jgi:hypothetical protein
MYSRTLAMRSRSSTMFSRTLATCSRTSAMRSRTLAMVSRTSVVCGHAVIRGGVNTHVPFRLYPPKPPPSAKRIVPLCLAAAYTNHQQRSMFIFLFKELKL